MRPDDREERGRGRAAQEDAGSDVSQRLEQELVSAFRAYHTLSALRDDDPNTVPPHLETHLVAAFREHHARAKRRIQVRRFTWHASRAAVLLAAMAGAVWFGLPRSSNRSPGRPPAGTVAGARQSSSVLTNAKGPTREVPRPSLHARARSGRNGRQSVSVRPARALGAAGVAAPEPGVEYREDLDDDGFMTSYGDGSLEEETHVVTLEVPRSALLDFGVQADVIPDDGVPVRAEVLVSEDGMPRGIRFVDRVPGPLRPSGPGRTPLPSPRRLQP